MTWPWETASSSVRASVLLWKELARQISIDIWEMKVSLKMMEANCLECSFLPAALALPLLQWSHSMAGERGQGGDSSEHQEGTGQMSVLTSVVSWLVLETWSVDFMFWFEKFLSKIGVYCIWFAAWWLWQPDLVVSWHCHVPKAWQELIVLLQLISRAPAVFGK